MAIESAGLGPGQVFVAPRSRPCSGLDPDRLLLGDMLLDRRGELVALGGPKPFFKTLSLPFSSIAYLKSGESAAPVTPRPGIGGVGVAGGVPGPSPSSKNELARASRGPLAGAPRSATPQGSTTPGYWAWPPSLAPARARRTRTPAGEGSVLAELHPSRSSFALETPSREITPTFLTR